MDPLSSNKYALITESTCTATFFICGDPSVGGVLKVPSKGLELQLNGQIYSIPSSAWHGALGSAEDVDVLHHTVILVCKLAGSDKFLHSSWRNYWIPNNFFIDFITQQVLPETDAVLYFDADNLILSNKTEIWEYFEEEQRKNPFAVMTVADHVPAPTRYNYHFRDIPFFGNGGAQTIPKFRNERFSQDRLILSNCRN